MTRSNMDPCWQLVAHRGHAACFPENTLPAFADALAVGGCVLETDVQLTADGVPVLFHDRDLMRLCAVPGAIHEKTLDQIRELRVRNPVGGEGAPIPTLQDFAAWLDTRPGVEIYVELKRNSLARFGVDVVLDSVLPLLKPLDGRCVIISYDTAALAVVRQRTSFPIGAVFDDRADHRLPAVQALAAEWWLCRLDTLPPGPIRHSSHRLAVYECDDPRQARELLRRGVDRLETFAIGRLLTTLGRGSDER